MPRGGARDGAGRKSKPLSEKILEGNPGKRPLKVLNFVNPSLEETMSFPLPEYLSELSKGTDILPGADSIYKEVVAWLERTGCSHLISPLLIQKYAVLTARWIECENKNAQHGLLTRHPSIQGAAMESPFVGMGLNYLRSANAVWTQI